MSKLIDKLTEAQQAKIPEYQKEFLQIGLSTAVVDKAAAELAVTAAYKYIKKQPPSFLWVDGPTEGVLKAAQLHFKTNTPTKDQISEAANNTNYGSFEAYWVAFYAFIGEQLPVEKDELIQICRELVTQCGIFWTLEDVVIMGPKPLNIDMKDDKLHNPDGASLSYADGTAIFALNGQIYSSMMALAIEEMAEKKK